VEQKALIRRSTNGRPPWRRLLCLSLPASLTFIGGVGFLIADSLRPPSHACRATGALVLIASAAIQAMALRRIWRKPALFEVRDSRRRRYLYRWLIAGWLGCYAAAVGFGSRPGIEVLFAGMAAVWYAAWLWMRTCDVGLPGVAGRIWRSPSLGLIGRSLATVVFGVAAAEFGLRLYSCANEQLSSRMVVDAIKAQSAYVPYRDVTNRRKVTSESPSPVQPAANDRTFRIAILGDEVALSQCGETCCLRELQRRLSNVRVTNFGLPMAGPREYLAVFHDEVAPSAPDLVLCFLSVDSDVTEQIPLPGLFDWRGLKLCQLADRPLGMDLATGLLADADIALSWHRRHGRCEFLQDRARHLSVCRAPMGAEMRTRWDEIFARLVALSDECRERQLDFGIVVVPGDFQVNPALCETLQRRLGYSSNNVDIKLPQRRFALFAQQQQLELLDLLPHLENAGPAAFGHNDHRLSDRGAAVAADAVGTWIERGFSEQLAAAGRKRAIYTADLSRTALRR
jgi:hypothetical protein